MNILISDVEETAKTESGNTAEPTTPAFRPETSFGRDLLDFIDAMRALGFNNGEIGEALLEGVKKGLP